MSGTSLTGGDYLAAVSDPDWTIVGIADFDNDGNVDILWRNSSTGQNYVWFMNGTTLIGGDSLDAVPDLNWTIAP
jgi:hypothetical protein